MNKVDELLESLKSEGVLTTQSTFGLDREKAREKMSKFQLQNPYFYLLELVQAAHLLGTVSIVFRIDSDEMEMHWDGRVLTEEDFHDLYSAAFAKHTTRRGRALKHIAFAMGAVQALDVRKVVIDSPHDEGTLRWTQRGLDEDLTILPKRRNTTRVYIRERFRAGHLIEFWRALDDLLPEIEVLKTYTAKCSIPVLINGAQISGAQLSLSADQYRAVKRFILDDRKGTVGIDMVNANVSSLTIVQNGVLFGQHNIDFLPWSFDAVVESESLSTDLSRRVFVQDEAWAEIVDQVEGLACELLYGLLKAELNPSQHPNDRDSFIDAFDLATSVFEYVGYRRKEGKPITGALRKLALLCEQTPCFKGSVGVQACKYGELFSLRDFGVSLLQAQNTLFISYKRFVVVSDYNDQMVMRDANGESLMKSYLPGVMIEDVSKALEDIQDGLLQKKRWREAPLFKQFHLTYLLYPVVVESHGLTLVAGLRRPQNSTLHTTLKAVAKNRGLSLEHQSVLFFHAEEETRARLVEMRTCKHKYPELIIMVAGQLDVSTRFDEVLTNEALTNAMSEMILRIPEVYNALARDLVNNQHVPFGPNSANLISEFLLMATTTQAPAGLLKALLGSQTSVRGVAQPAWVNSAWAPCLDQNMLVAERLTRMDALADVQLFDVMFDRRISLTQVNKVYLGKKLVDTIKREDTSIFAAAREIFATGLPVLWFDDQQLQLISRFLDKQLRFAKSILMIEVQKRAFMNKAPQPLEPVETVFHVEDFLHHAQFDKEEAFEALQLGVLDPYGEHPQPIGDHTIVLDVFLDQRPLCTVDLPYMFGQLMGRLDVRSSHIEPTTAWDNVRPNRQWKALQKTVARYADTLWTEWIKGELDRPTSQRSSRKQYLLWELLTYSFVIKKSFKPIRVALETAPLFEIWHADHSDGWSFVSLEDIRDHSHHQVVVFGERGAWPDRVEPEEDHLFLVTPTAAEHSAPLVEALLPRAKVLKNVQALLAQHSMTKENMALFMARPVVPELDLTQYHVLSTHAVNHERVRGHVYMIDDPRGDLLLFQQGTISYTIAQSQRVVEKGTMTSPFSLGLFEVRLDGEDLINWSHGLGLNTGLKLPIMNAIERACLWVWYDLIEQCFEDPAGVAPAKRRALFAALLKIQSLKRQRLNQDERALKEALADVCILPTTRGWISLTDALYHASLTWELYYTDTPSQVSASLTESLLVFVPENTAMLESLEALMPCPIAPVEQWTPEPIEADDVAPVDAESADVQGSSTSTTPVHDQDLPVFEPAPFPTPSSSKPNKPKRKKKPKPTPSPTVPVIYSPEERYLRRVGAWLMQVRGAYSVLLWDAFVHNLTIRTSEAPDVLIDDTQVSVSTSHPVWRYAFERQDDPIALAFLGSSLYSTINEVEDKITDDHELTYLSQMITHVLNQTMESS